MQIGSTSPVTQAPVVAGAGAASGENTVAFGTLLDASVARGQASLGETPSGPSGKREEAPAQGTGGDGIAAEMAALLAGPAMAVLVKPATSVSEGGSVETKDGISPIGCVSATASAPALDAGAVAGGVDTASSAPVPPRVASAQPELSRQASSAVGMVAPGAGEASAEKAPDIEAQATFAIPGGVEKDASAGDAGTETKTAGPARVIDTSARGGQNRAEPPATGLSGSTAVNPGDTPPVATTSSGRTTTADQVSDWPTAPAVGAAAWQATIDGAGTSTPATGGSAPATGTSTPVAGSGPAGPSIAPQQGDPATTAAASAAAGPSPAPKAQARGADPTEGAPEVGGVVESAAQTRASRVSGSSGASDARTGEEPPKFAARARAATESKGSGEASPLAGATGTQVAGPARAAAPEAAYAALQGAGKEELLRQMVSHAGRLNLSANPSMRVQLKPESLGSVDMNLSMRDGVLTLDIRTELAQTRQMIEAALPQLRYALGERGLDATQVSLSLLGSTSSGGEYAAAGNWQGDQPRAGDYPAPGRSPAPASKPAGETAERATRSASTSSHLIDYTV